MLFKNLLAKTKDSTKISMCQKVDWFLWKKIHLQGLCQIQMLTAPVVEVDIWRLSVPAQRKSQFFNTRRK